MGLANESIEVDENRGWCFQVSCAHEHGAAAISGTSALESSCDGEEVILIGKAGAAAVNEHLFTQCIHPFTPESMYIYYVQTKIDKQNQVHIVEQSHIMDSCHAQ